MSASGAIVLGRMDPEIVNIAQSARLKDQGSRLSDDQSGTGQYRAQDLRTVLERRRYVEVDFGADLFAFVLW